MANDDEVLRFVGEINREFNTSSPLTAEGILEKANRLSDIPFREERQPVEPEPAAEEVFEQPEQQFDWNTEVSRFAQNLGPGSVPEEYVPRAINHAMSIFGEDPQQAQDFAFDARMLQAARQDFYNLRTDEWNELKDEIQADPVLSKRYFDHLARVRQESEMGIADESVWGKAKKGQEDLESFLGWRKGLTSFARGARNVMDLPFKFADIGRDVVSDARERLGLGDGEIEFPDAMEKALDNAEFWRRRSAVLGGSDLYGYRVTDGLAKKALTQGISGALENAPQMMAAMALPGAPKGTKLFSKAAFFNPRTLMLSAQILPGVHDTLRERGLKADTALLAAVPTALASGKVEDLALGVFDKWLGVKAYTIGKQATKSTLDAAIGVAANAAKRTSGQRVLGAGWAYFTELAEEGAQGMIEGTAEYLAGRVADNPIAYKDVIHSSWDQVKQAALSMPWTMLGGRAMTGVSTAISVAAGYDERYTSLNQATPDELYELIVNPKNQQYLSTLENRKQFVDLAEQTHNDDIRLLADLVVADQTGDLSKAVKELADINQQSEFFKDAIKQENFVRLREKMLELDDLSGDSTAGGDELQKFYLQALPTLKDRGVLDEGADIDNEFTQAILNIHPKLLGKLLKTVDSKEDPVGLIRGFLKSPGLGGFAPALRKIEAHPSKSTRDKMTILLAAGSVTNADVEGMNDDQMTEISRSNVSRGLDRQDVASLFTVEVDPETGEEVESFDVEAARRQIQLKRQTPTFQPSVIRDARNVDSTTEFSPERADALKELREHPFSKAGESADWVTSYQDATSAQELAELDERLADRLAELDAKRPLERDVDQQARLLEFQEWLDANFPEGDARDFIERIMKIIDPQFRDTLETDARFGLAENLGAMGRIDIDPRTGEATIQLDEQTKDLASFFFAHEVAHFGFETFLLPSEQDAVRRIYEKALAEGNVDEEWLENANNKYDESLHHKEWFSDAFAKFVHQQAVPEGSRLRRFFNKLLKSFRKMFTGADEKVPELTQYLESLIDQEYQISPEKVQARNVARYATNVGDTPLWRTDDEDIPEVEVFEDLDAQAEDVGLQALPDPDLETLESTEEFDTFLSDPSQITPTENRNDLVYVAPDGTGVSKESPMLGGDQGPGHGTPEVKAALLGQGFVRVQAGETGTGLEVHGTPTNEQLTKMVDLITDAFDSSVVIDVMDEQGNRVDVLRGTGEDFDTERKLRNRITGALRSQTFESNPEVSDVSPQNVLVPDRSEDSARDALLDLAVSQQEIFEEWKAENPVEPEAIEEFVEAATALALSSLPDNVRDKVRSGSALTPSESEQLREVRESLQRSRDSVSEGASFYVNELALELPDALGEDNPDALEEAKRALPGFAESSIQQDRFSEMSAEEKRRRTRRRVQDPTTFFSRPERVYSSEYIPKMKEAVDRLPSGPISFDQLLDAFDLAGVTEAEIQESDIQTYFRVNEGEDQEVNREGLRWYLNNITATPEEEEAQRHIDSIDTRLEKIKEDFENQVLDMVEVEDLEGDRISVEFRGEERTFILQPAMEGYYRIREDEEQPAEEPERRTPEEEAARAETMRRLGLTVEDMDETEREASSAVSWSVFRVNSPNDVKKAALKKMGFRDAYVAERSSEEYKKLKALREEIFDEVYLKDLRGQTFFSRPEQVQSDVSTDPEVIKDNDEKVTPVTTSLEETLELYEAGVEVWDKLPKETRNEEMWKQTMSDALQLPDAAVNRLWQVLNRFEDLRPRTPSERIMGLLHKRLMPLERAVLKRESKAIRLEGRARTKAVREAVKLSDKEKQAEIFEDFGGYVLERLGEDVNADKRPPRSVRELGSRIVKAAEEAGRQKQTERTIETVAEMTFQGMHDRFKDDVKYYPSLKKLANRISQLEEEMEGLEGKELADHVKNQLPSILGSKAYKFLRRHTRRNPKKTFDALSVALDVELGRQLDYELEQLLSPDGVLSSLMEEGRVPAEDREEVQELLSRGTNPEDYTDEGLIRTVERARDLREEIEGNSKRVMAENKVADSKMAVRLADSIRANSIYNDLVGPVSTAEVNTMLKLWRKGASDDFILRAVGADELADLRFEARRNQRDDEVDLVQQYEDAMETLELDPQVVKDMHLEGRDYDFGEVKWKGKTYSTKFTLSGWQRVALYAYSMDPDAKEKILANGFLPANERDKVDPIPGFALGKVMEFELKRDSERAEKEMALARRMMEIGSEYALTKGNAASQAVAGIDKFRFNNFFTLLGAPIVAGRADSIDPEKAINDILASDPQPGEVKDTGAAKERQDHTNPIAIQDGDALFRHWVRTLSVYSNWARPYQTMNRIINGFSAQNTAPGSIRAQKKINEMLKQMLGQTRHARLWENVKVLSYQERLVPKGGFFQTAANLLQGRQLAFSLTSWANNRYGGLSAYAAQLEADGKTKVRARLLKSLIPRAVLLGTLKEDEESDLEIMEGFSKYLYERWERNPYHVAAGHFGKYDIQDWDSLRANETLLTKWKKTGRDNLEKLEKYAYAPMISAEQKNAVDLFRALKDIEGLTDEAASLEVERLTRRTQNPSDPVDAPEIYLDTQKNPIARLFIPFIGQPAITKQNWMRNRLEARRMREQATGITNEKERAYLTEQLAKTGDDAISPEKRAEYLRRLNGVEDAQERSRLLRMAGDKDLFSWVGWTIQSAVTMVVLSIAGWMRDGFDRKTKTKKALAQKKRFMRKWWGTEKPIPNSFFYAANNLLDDVLPGTGNAADFAGAFYDLVAKGSMRDLTDQLAPSLPLSAARKVGKSLQVIHRGVHPDKENELRDFYDAVARTSQVVVPVKGLFQGLEFGIGSWQVLEDIVDWTGDKLGDEPEWDL